MKTLVSLTATILLVLVGLNIDANSTYRTVSFHCKDRVTNQGIDGVTVSALQGDNVISSSSSDYSGQVSLQVPSNQTYTFKAELDGEDPQSKDNVYVSSGSSTLDGGDFLY